MTKNAMKQLKIVLFALLLAVFAAGAVSVVMQPTTVYAADYYQNGVRLANSSSGGHWYTYYSNGQRAKVTGVYQNSHGWWYVKNGEVDFNYTGLAQNAYGWWYCKKGQVTFNYTGFVDNEYGRWRVENSKVNFNYKNVAQDSGQWRFYSGGKWQNTTNSVECNSNGWWCIKNGVVDFDFNGFAKNSSGWWYCKGGKVQFGVNSVIQGTVNGESGWWHVVDGKVTFDNTVAQNSNGWWIIRNGKVDFDYTGLAQNSSGWWRIESGKVNFNFKGFAKNDSGWWYCEGGKVQFGVNSVIQGTVNGESGWWHVVGGKVQFDNTVAQNPNGWWIIRNGRVDFNYTGIAGNEYGWWRIESGKVNFNCNGVLTVDGNMYNFLNGEITVSKTYVQTKNTASGNTLRGFVYRPGNITGKTVIICHGLGGYAEQADPIAKYLAQNGYNVFAFDFSGGGPYCKSDGATTRMSVLTELNDLEYIYNYVASQSYVSANEISIAGHSQGGLVAGLYAANNPSKVKTLMLYAPGFVVAEEWAPKSYSSIPKNNVYTGSFYLGPVYYQDLWTLLSGDAGKLYPYMGKYEGPVLILQGTGDTVTSPNYTRKVCNYYKNETLKEYSGADHVFSGNSNHNKFLNDTLNFLNSH